MQNIITKFTQMNASGELTSGSITKMEKTLPGFAKTLSTTMGVSRDKLNELAKDGKISMSDLSKTIENMSAAKPKGLENYLTSFDGFSAHLQEKYQSLSGKITEGFFKTNNNFLKNMSKSLDGEETEKAFTHIGDSANKAVTTISTAFSSVFKGTKNPLADFANGLANEIEKLGNFISKHANDIKNFFGMVKDLGGAAFKLIGDTLKTVLPWLENFGTWASKHPEDVKKIALAIIGLNIALKGTLGTAVSGIVTLLDYTDPLTCTIDSTAGSIFKNGSGTTTLTCRVFQSGAEIDTAGTTYTYKWSQRDQNGVLNANFGGTGNQYKTGKTISVAATDINVKAQYTCEVNQ